jgi:hypothetical protein
MSGVPVTVTPATETGRLYPRYLNSIGTLTLESRPPRLSQHGVSIDGMVILDFDENRILAGVELIAPISAWKGKLPVVRPLGKPADIRLGEELAGSVSYDWRVVVSKDMQRDMARISFNGSDFDRAVALSDRAAALLQGERLTGFWFSLAR